MSQHDRRAATLLAVLCAYFILGVVTLGPIHKAWRTGCHPVDASDVTVVLLWPILYIESQTARSGC